jgi:hypothetical protein
MSKRSAQSERRGTASCAPCATPLIALSRRRAGAKTIVGHLRFAGNDFLSLAGKTISRGLPVVLPSCATAAG